VTLAAAIRPIELRLLTLENNLVLAPMAGISNLPCRLIARKAGAALSFSETVSAKGLVMGGRKTRSLLDSSPGEAPIAFQLFGAEPETLGRACRQLEDEGIAWIDLNAGCPVKKFIKRGAGAALLRDLPRAAAIVRAMRGNFSGTLSVKTRAGWDAASINAPEFARMAAEEGAELISVHGRTCVQQYAGEVDRRVLRRVVEAAGGVPVLANGDITRPEHVFEMLRDTGAAGVMIGRGAVGNPWIFEQALSLARRGSWRAPTPRERIATIERHVALMQGIYPHQRAFAESLKRTLAAYSKGLPGSADFRRAALGSADPDQILDLALHFFASLPRAA
jgi:nifR3 family TIM-barrel protein